MGESGGVLPIDMTRDDMARQSTPESWEYMSIDDIRKVLIATSVLKPRNELALYKKWIPRLLEKIKS